MPFSMKLWLVQGQDLLETDEQNVEAQNARVFNNPIFKAAARRLEPHVLNSFKS